MIRALAIALFFLPAVTLAQSVLERQGTLVLNNATLEQALSETGKQWLVDFSYSDDVVPVNTLVSINVTNGTLRDVLKELLHPLSLEYKVSGTRIILRKAPAPLVQTVRGTITDSYTHAPLAGVSIIVAGSQPLLGAVSGSDGKFKIEKVSVGRTTLQISTIGYNTQIISNILLGTGKELVLEIKLTEAWTPVEEVVITANRDASLVDNQNSSLSTHAFTVEDTRRYAGSIGDPARMAASFAGVTGASDESNALIVRGNSPRGVLWRIDGIEVPNPNHFASEGSSNGMVSVLSTNIIDNSAFFTSAFPAWYGNALSAVFDMKLRNGNNEKHEHSFQAGVLGIEASSEGPFSRRHSSSYLINYRYSTLDILDRLGADLNQAGEFKNYQDVSFKLHFPLRHDDQLSLFGIGGTSKSNRQTSSLLNNDQSDVGVAGVTYQKNIGNTSVSSSISWSGTQIGNDHELRGLSNGPLKVEENYSKSYVRAMLSAGKKMGDRFYLDGGLIYTSLHYNFYLRNLDPSNQVYAEIVNFRERNSTGIMQAFVNTRQRISSSLSAEYGVHFLQFALTNDYAVEPRVRLRYQLTDNQVFTFGYGKHSRIENLQYYLARDHQAGGNEVQINKNLGFTRAHHLVAGYGYKLQHDHLLKIETYFQKLYNTPVQSDPSSVYALINEDSGFITDTLINNGNGKNYGVELSLERSFANNFYYLINGSLFQSRFRIGDEAEHNTAYNGNYNYHLLAGKEFRFRDSRNMLGVNIRITGAGGKRYVPIDLEASIEKGHEVYRWDEAFEPRLPAYFRTDFQLVYRRNKARYTSEWRLDIQNLTHHTNAAYYFFDASTSSLNLKRQVSILPILSYRIEL